MGAKSSRPYNALVIHQCVRSNNTVGLPTTLPEELQEFMEPGDWHIAVQQIDAYYATYEGGACCILKVYPLVLVVFVGLFFVIGWIAIPIGVGVASAVACIQSEYFERAFRRRGKRLTEQLNNGPLHGALISVVDGHASRGQYMSLVLNRGVITCAKNAPHAAETTAIPLDEKFLP